MYEVQFIIHVCHGYWAIYAVFSYNIVYNQLNILLLKRWLLSFTCPSFTVQILIMFSAAFQYMEQ